MIKPTKAELVALMDDVELTIGERKRMLTVAEFARCSGHHPDTVRRDCAWGNLPSQQARKNAPYLIHFHQLLSYVPSERVA